jgi:hypothetical protein
MINSTHCFVCNKELTVRDPVYNSGISAICLNHDADINIDGSIIKHYFKIVNRSVFLTICHEMPSFYIHKIYGMTFHKGIWHTHHGFNQASYLGDENSTMQDLMQTIKTLELFS